MQRLNPNGFNHQVVTPPMPAQLDASLDRVQTYMDWLHEKNMVAGFDFLVSSNKVAFSSLKRSVVGVAMLPPT